MMNTPKAAPKYVPHANGHRIFKSADGEYSTNYAPNEISQMINDFYYDQKVAAGLAGPIGKSAGYTGYNTTAAFNAIFGEQIMAGMLSSKNTLTLLGAKPYTTEGVRIAYMLAQKGGIGASTDRDGDLPTSVTAPMEKIRQPTKVLPFAWSYGMTLQALENKDDTIAYKSYADLMTTNYSDSLDFDLLRGVTATMPTVNGHETTITPLRKIIASGEEVGATYGTTAVTGAMVSPWGGASSDIYSYRNVTTPNNFDAYVDNGSGTASVLTLARMNSLYTNCAYAWNEAGSSDNKAIICSPYGYEAVGALQQAQNIMTESVFVQRSLNGVKTMPGRDGGGVLINSYRNIGMFPDANMIIDATTQRMGTNIGDLMMADLDHNWISVLSPVEFASTRDYAVTRHLREDNVFLSNMELRSDKFIGSGVITNLTSS